MALQKTNKEGYYKDTDSQLVVNRNEGEYNTYLAMRQKIKENQTLHNEMAKMHGELDEIKQLLQKVLNLNG